MFYYDFKFEIGDKVDVNVNNISGVIKQRKIEFHDLGSRDSLKESYLVTYDKTGQNWFYDRQLTKVNDLALKNEYAVLSVIIDSNLKERKFDLAAQFKQERDALDEGKHK